MVAQQYPWQQYGWPGGPQAPTAWQRAMQAQGAGAQQATPAGGAAFDRYAVARDTGAPANGFPATGPSQWYDAPAPPPQTNGPAPAQPQPYQFTTSPMTDPGQGNVTLAGGGPAQGAGVGGFGTQYTDPGGGWNPWSLYDGREGFDGSAQDGWYDATRDTAHWQNNGQPETDRDRVWRWTLDAAKAQGWDAGAAQNAEHLKAEFLHNVTRLKRDYNAPENAGLGGWGNSAFAGYDRMPKLAGGGQLTNPGGQAPGQAAPGSPAPAGQIGGTGMAEEPGYGSPGSGQQPGRGTYNTSTGQNRVSGGLGQFNSSDWLTALNAAKDNPDIAAHLLRLAQGQTGRVTSKLGRYADNLYGRALQAYMNATGLAGSGIPDMQQGIQGFYGAMQGNNLIDYLGNAAGGIMGADFSGMNDQDIETQLRAAIALRSLGVGAGASSQMGSALDNILYQQEARGLGGRQFDTTDNNLGTLLGGSAFKKYMDLYNQSR